MAGGTGRYGSCKWKHVFPRVKVQDVGIPKVNKLALKKKSVLLISHCNGEAASSVSWSLDDSPAVFSQVKICLKCSEEAVIDFDAYFIVSGIPLDLTNRFMKTQYLLYHIHA